MRWVEPVDKSRYHCHCECEKCHNIAFVMMVDKDDIDKIWIYCAMCGEEFYVDRKCFRKD